MSLLLVTYDLKKPDRDYTGVHNAIKTAPQWWHHLDSTWIIRTTETTQVWSERIRQAMDENDFLLVIDISKRPRFGWLPKSAWDWLRENDV